MAGRQAGRQASGQAGSAHLEECLEQQQGVAG
jgi:hypothetical protein